MTCHVHDLYLISYEDFKNYLYSLSKLRHKIQFRKEVSITQFILKISHH